MTREQAINYLFSCGFTQEQVCDVVRALTYEPTTKNDLGVDAVSRKDVHDMLENLPVIVEDKWFNWLQKACMRLAELPSVTPQEPRCKNCKWWKDSDGEYRRGCGAESKCPINRREVFEGNGYCYLYEPQESEE